MAFHYGFTKHDILELTRRQIVLYLENLNNDLNKDLALQAKLHGFKMKAPMKVQKWTKEDDKRITDRAQERYERMMKEAEAKSGG